jgi:hypothetical protein
MVGAGGEVVVAVPGAVLVMGDVEPGVFVQEAQADGGGDGLLDEHALVAGVGGELGAKLVGEGGDVGREGRHGRGSPGTGAEGGSMTTVSKPGRRVGDSRPGKGVGRTWPAGEPGSGGRATRPGGRVGAFR